MSMDIVFQIVWPCVLGWVFFENLMLFKSGNFILQFVQFFVCFCAQNGSLLFFAYPESANVASSLSSCSKQTWP